MQNILCVQDSGKDDSFPDSDRFTYYGYKFESLCTGGGDGVVDSTSESGVVVRSKLNDLDVIIGAEVDACDIPQEQGRDSIPDLSTFVELKTSRFARTVALVKYLTSSDSYDQYCAFLWSCWEMKSATVSTPYKIGIDSLQFCWYIIYKYFFPC